MRVCVLYPFIDASTTYSKYDYPYHPQAYYTKDDPRGAQIQVTTPKGDKNLGNLEFDVFALKKATSQLEVYNLIKSQKYDLFFNLCDGGWDEDKAGIEVIKLLEQYNVPFVGSDSLSYKPTKEVMKTVCYYNNIPTAPHILCHTIDDMKDVIEYLTFPMIVKHPDSDNSVGMTAKSKVTNIDELTAELTRFITEFGSGMVEEYIDGDEYSVLIIEDYDFPNKARALKPVKTIFPPGESFKHFDLKWVNHHDMTSIPVDDENLSKALEDIALQFYIGSGCTSFARCDIRQDKHTGKLYVLEINPMCSIFYAEEANWGTADYIMGHADPIGHLGAIYKLIESAFKRYNQKQQPFEIIQKKKIITVDGQRKLTYDYGMVARRDIKQDEIIHKIETNAKYIVSKKHVDTYFTPKEMEWFGSYAYPLNSAGTSYIIWSNDPKEWKPFNHSCAPTACLNGFNFVAHRDIRKGESITIEYGTLCDEIMTPFQCTCGSENCRGNITGNDWRLEYLQTSYKGKFSPAIQQKIDELKQ